MIRYVVFLIVFILFGATTHADVNAGREAYRNKDYPRALEELQPLADQGDGNAQFLLGRMYEAGKGVTQDYIQAHVWFNLAAAQGDDRAIDARERIAKSMTPQQVARAQRIARRWKPKTGVKEAAAQEGGEPETPAPSAIALIRPIQEHLAALGYEPGAADGIMGSMTREAIGDYQEDAGLPVDGQPSQDLLQRLQEEMEQQRAQVQVPQKAGDSRELKAPMKTGDASGGQTQAVIDRLKEIVRKGEEQGRADSQFIAELRGLIMRYDRPWPDRIFSDAFRDGDLTKAPAWNVVSGNFRVDAEKRLVTQVDAPGQDEVGSERQGEDPGTLLLKSLLGEVLDEKGQGATRPEEPLRAEIATGVPISNAFLLDIKVALLAGGNGSKLEIGPYRGPERNEGYRLVYAGGQGATFQLVRQSSWGTTVLEASQPLSQMKDGRVHGVAWRRYPDGTMVVAVDGEEILRTRDRTFQESFDGLVIVNHNGDYAFRRIDVFGREK